MKHLYMICQFCLLLVVALPTRTMGNSVVISEFMAINSSLLTDEDGHFSDWIEIYNASFETVHLKGWFLTDRADRLTKWAFPDISISAGQYMVVFASEKNRTNPSLPLHTNFKLSGTGEFLAIVQPDSTLSHAYQPTFPAQRQNVSFGLYHGQEVFFTNPTPGQANKPGNLPFAPQFSVGRGYYTQAFEVTLTVPVPGNNIYYTLNGTRPTTSNALLYTSPIRITTTTPLSAVVIDHAGNSSEIITHTYLFINDIIKQPKAPAGYPTDWRHEGAATAIAADYEMDQRVVTHANYRDLWPSVMHSIPTVSVVTDIGNLFSNKNNAITGGIYIYTGRPSSVGTGWVRPASAEYFDPNTGKQFQINCGLELHGGNSRNPGNSPKHGFKLRFRSIYGPPKLHFNLFEESTATNEFNSLVLRAGYNYTWVKNSVAQQTPAQYLQDSWSKNTQLAMNQLSAHEKFVHLYLNGLYWGMYNISEHLTNDFMESYLPGREEDFDIVKERHMVSSGNIDAWNALRNQITGVETNVNYQRIQGKTADGTTDPSIPNLIEIDNYIDYMLINYYIANQDWDTNNWLVARNRVHNHSGFRFFCWDTETSMINVNDNRIITGTAGNPAAFMQHLRKNSDFRVRLADRIKQHLIDEGGALTPQETAKRYAALAAEIDLAIIGESARWSDWFPPHNPYTKTGHWIPRRNELMSQYFPQRTNILLNQLRTSGMYPSIQAPQFSHPQGTYNQSIQLSISGTGGTLFYTTDGTDPRLQMVNTPSNQAITYASPLSIAQTTTVKARIRSATEWSALSEATFTIQPVSGYPHLTDNLLSLNASPNPFQSNTRIQMNVPVSGELKVHIYDLRGQLIDVLYAGVAPTGLFELTWVPNRQLPQGMYICRVVIANKHAVLKIMKH